MRRTAAVLAVVVSAVAGCRAEPRLELQESLEILPADNCVPGAPRASPALFDLVDTGHARALTAALEGAVIVDEAADAFIVVDEAVVEFNDLADGFDGEGPRSAGLIVGDGCLPDDCDSRVSPGRTKLVAVLDVVTAAEAAELLERLGPALGTQGDRLTFDVDVSLRAQLVVEGKIEELESSVLTVPISVCTGCLVPTCDDGAEPVGQTCFVGVDDALRCE